MDGKWSWDVILRSSGATILSFGLNFSQTHAHWHSHASQKPTIPGHLFSSISSSLQHNHQQKSSIFHLANALLNKPLHPIGIPLPFLGFYFAMICALPGGGCKISRAQGTLDCVHGRTRREAITCPKVELKQEIGALLHGKSPSAREILHDLTKTQQAAPVP